MTRRTPVRPLSRPGRRQRHIRRPGRRPASLSAWRAANTVLIALMARAGPLRTMSTGSSRAGTGSLWGGRLLAPILLTVAVAVSGCAPADQLGSRQDAAAATDDFLGALTGGDAHYAWDHLTPATREALFAGDADAFAREVTSADWSAFQWEVGPITDYDTSWGVHVKAEIAALPNFLLNSGLAGEYDDGGIVLLIQFAESGEYVVAGQGLDTDLR